MIVIEWAGLFYSVAMAAVGQWILIGRGVDWLADRAERRMVERVWAASARGTAEQSPPSSVSERSGVSGGSQ